MRKMSKKISDRNIERRTIYLANELALWYKSPYILLIVSKWRYLLLYSTVETRITICRHVYELRTGAWTGAWMQIGANWRVCASRAIKEGALDEEWVKKW